MDFKRQIKIAALAIVVLGFTIGYKVIHTGQAGKITNLKRAIDDRRQRNELLKGIADIGKGLKRYQNSFFISDSTSALVDRIDKFAFDSGVKINNLRPQKVALKEIYGIIPLSLELEGTYHQLGKLLSLIENYDKVIRLVELDVKRSRVYHEAPEIPNITARLQLEGFFLIKD